MIILITDSQATADTVKTVAHEYDVAVLNEIDLVRIDYLCATQKKKILIVYLSNQDVSFFPDLSKLRKQHWMDEVKIVTFSHPPTPADIVNSLKLG